MAGRLEADMAAFDKLRNDARAVGEQETAGQGRTTAVLVELERAITRVRHGLVTHGTPRQPQLPQQPQSQPQQALHPDAEAVRIARLQRMAAETIPGLTRLDGAPVVGEFVMAPFIEALAQNAALRLRWSQQCTS